MNNNGSKTGIHSVGNTCNLSDVRVLIDIIEVAHAQGVTPYLDKVRVILTDDSTAPDSIVLHIGGKANIDLTDYESGFEGMPVFIFNTFGNQRNIEFDPMDDRMILSIISRGKAGNTNCVKNIYP